MVQFQGYRAKVKVTAATNGRAQVSAQFQLNCESSESAHLRAATTDAATPQVTSGLSNLAKAASNPPLYAV